jgi:carbamoylphosphate synthase large subunit
MKSGLASRQPPRPSTQREAVPAGGDPPATTVARRGDRAKTRARPVPAILFVDDGPLTPFVQLAVVLRRSGYRTIRVTTTPHSIGSSITRRIAFDRELHVKRAALAGLDHLLAAELLVDVQCSEHVAVDVYRALAHRQAPVGATGWRHRADLIDKWKVVRLLDAVGIAHPDAVAGETPPAEAVQALGLPIVVKPRLGAYGEGILLARTFGELEAHLATVRPADVLLEAFIDGTPANYCAVVGDGAERDMTYRTLRRGEAAWSASIEIACYRDDVFSEIGRKLAAALPCEGLLNVDAIRDAQGRYLVHDVNLRVWGAFFASWNAGYELTSAYLRWLGDQVRRSAGEREQTARIFPDYADTVSRTGRRAGLRVFAEQLSDYRRLLGLRYVAREVLHSARLLVSSRRRSGVDHRR